MDPISAYSDPKTMPSSAPHRLARLLSISVEEPLDDVSLAHKVSGGLPARSLHVLSVLIGRKRIVGSVVPEPSLRRVQRERKRLSKQHSERLYELSRVIDAVSRVFHGDNERIREFMLTPHHLLDGETPFDMGRSSSAGADAVINLVRRADAGIAL